MVKAAVRNEGNGKEVMLDRQGDRVEITKRIVKAAARNRRSGKEVMALLLDQRGDQIEITEDVVEAAAGNKGNGKELMALLRSGSLRMCTRKMGRREKNGGTAAGSMS